MGYRPYRNLISLINKRWSFPTSSRVGTIIRLHHLDFNETLEEKAWWELHKDAVSYFDKIQESAPYKTATVRPLTSHIINHPRSDGQYMQGFAGELKANW